MFNLFILNLEQQLYVGVLKHLSDQIATQMLTKFTYGAQHEFYYNWKRWIKSINQQEDTIAQNKEATSIVPNSQIVEIPQASHSDVVHNICNINLNEILRTGPYGPGVVSYYQKHGELNDRMRKLLVEAFLYYCTNNEVSVTKSACQDLSQQIVRAFKGEIMVSKN